MAGEGFLSEDGSSFTVIKDDIKDVKKDEGNDNSVGLDIDIDKIPEELRGTFNKLLGDLKEKSSSLDSLKEKADFASVVKELIKSRSNEKDTTKDSQEDDDPFKDLSFEEGDYYRKFLEPLMAQIKTLNKKIKDLGGEVVETKKTTWVETVKTFVKQERLSDDVVLKMDELAKSMGAGVYNDLPRLAKLAKLELGIKDKADKKDDDDGDIEQKKRNVVNFTNRRKGADVKKVPVKSMMDAWNAAEDDLAQND